jgi:amino acid efflux transporter
VIVVGVLYLSVAFATITVLGPGAGETDAPLGDLLAIGLGGDARILAAAAALLLTFGAMNAYYAGAARLGAALARDRSLPAWLERGSAADEIPRRSLAVLTVMSMSTAVVVVAAGIGPSSLVLLTTGLFVTVYAVGVAAAVKLLPRRSKARFAAMVAQGAVVILLLMAGPYLIWPVIVTAAALLYLRLARQRRP